MHRRASGKLRVLPLAGLLAMGLAVSTAAPSRRSVFWHLDEDRARSVKPKACGPPCALKLSRGTYTAGGTAPASIRPSRPSGKVTPS